MALIHHIVEGKGSPPIVFVHGLCCSHTDWRHQVDHFARRHMTVAVDLPGHGASPPGADAASIEQCGMEVEALLRALALPSAVLVGHSMGCRVVLDAGLRAPEHVAGIVLVDGSRFGPAMTQIFEAAFAAGEYRALLRDLFEQMFTARSAPDAVATVIERALVVPEGVGRALLLSLVRYDVDKLEGALERTARPLLVLQTTFVDQSRKRASMSSGQATPYLDFIRAKVPGARIQVLPGLGHFPQLDAPAATNEVLERFLADLASR